LARGDTGLLWWEREGCVLTVPYRKSQINTQNIPIPTTTPSTHPTTTTTQSHHTHNQKFITIPNEFFGFIIG